MIPLVVSGIFLAGLVVVGKINKPSEPWKSREEQRDFRKEQEKWIHEGWMLYR